MSWRKAKHFLSVVFGGEEWGITWNWRGHERPISDGKKSRFWLDYSYSNYVFGPLHLWWYNPCEF